MHIILGMTKTDPFNYKFSGMAKKPFSLTYIQYEEDDGLFGWIMALMSLAPVYSAFSLAAYIL